MALVQYSDTESDTENEGPPRKTAKLWAGGTSNSRQVSSLPPLPPKFHDLYASNIRISVRDDPSLHGGRKRVIPHVEGNWPTHIYLEWYPSKEELGILGDIIGQAEHILDENETKIHSLLHSDLGSQLPLHISLSRPVVLRTEQRESFTDTFHTTLQDYDISSFNALLEGLDCVSNFEKTRWFYVLRVKRPEKDNLNRLLRVSNYSLVRFEQPPLYGSINDSLDVGGKHQITLTSAKDHTHCFHISIAWSLLEPSDEQRKRIANINLRKLSELKVKFDCLKVKIGNQISSILLSS